MAKALKPNAKETKRKIDKIALAKRISAVQDWILQDLSTTDIIIKSIAKWKITDRQAYRYLWAANRFFQEKDKLSIERKKAYYMARKKKLLRDMNADEKKTAAGVVAANRVLDSMLKLEGITTETLKVIGDPDNPITTVSSVITPTNVDYKKLPTELLEFIVKNRKEKNV